MAETSGDRPRGGRRGTLVCVRWPSGGLSGEGFPDLGESPQALTASELEAARRAAQAAGVRLEIEEGGA